MNEAALAHWGLLGVGALYEGILSFENSMISSYKHECTFDCSQEMYNVLCTNFHMCAGIHAQALTHA
jgi:hypothetical protein